MLNIDDVRQKIGNLKPIIRERYKVRTIGVFGSYVRGEAKEKSDLDVLVDFSKPISLLKFVELENFLSDSIGVRVDLVMKNALKPRIGKHILEEVVAV